MRAADGRPPGIAASEGEKMGRRITRKQLKENEFVSAFDALMQWMSENWRPLVAALGAVVVVALLWWAASQWSGARTAKASDLLDQATGAYEEAGGATATPDAAGMAEAERMFGEVVDRYGRSDQADVARLYLARIQLSRGDLDDARQTLVRLVERNRGDALGRLAELDLIHLRIASGQGAEVVKELEAMVAGADTSLPRDTAMYELGLLLISERDYDRAREVLQTLVDDFQASPYRQAARDKLTEIGG